MQSSGVILKGIGGFYYVLSGDTVFECKARGIFRKEKQTPLAGDRVLLSAESVPEQGVIESILERKNSLIRPPVANLDRLFVVASSVEPSLNLFITDKMEMCIRDSAYGRECCEELLKASFGRPPLTVRVNTQKCTAQALMEALSEEHVLAVTNPIVPNAIDLTSTGSIERLNAFQNGWFHVQDAASQLLCYAFGAKPGERIADVCSAPGGKSFTIAEQMCGEGSVDAFDLYSARVQLIQQGAERLGLQNIRTAERNAENGDAAPLYDRVLCDVPCSGLGILRRKPEIRLKSPETLDNLPSVQYCILVQSSQMVCPEIGRAHV